MNQVSLIKKEIITGGDVYLSMLIQKNQSPYTDSIYTIQDTEAAWGDTGAGGDTSSVYQPLPVIAG